MTEKILIYLLEGCMYTQLILNILKNYNFYYNIIFVNQNEKDSIKQVNNMYSFPQIYYILDEKTSKYKIGGYEEFNLLNNFKFNKKTFKNDIMILQKNLDLDKKILLRILIYINKKITN